MVGAEDIDAVMTGAADTRPAGRAARRTQANKRRLQGKRYEGLRSETDGLAIIDRRNEHNARREPTHDVPEAALIDRGHAVAPSP